jgi:hypothetical protein
VELSLVRPGPRRCARCRPAAPEPSRIIWMSALSGSDWGEHVSDADYEG